MEEAELIARLNRADAMACLAAGRTKALEYGLRLFIATHPAREEVARAWQQLLAVIAEEHWKASPAIPDVLMYQAGIQQVLEVLTGQFEARGRSPDPSD
ncbi:hypothetical protein FHW84_001797 [Dyella sp. SG562]|uniref:hypothetical protein n=1 Tax=Dyella sp. SG562 TaxID=2587017 RepID=UPI001420DF72|nr:hypothetical protein [Dyella sp. SG562]NII73228.1 hypothetical protein [Dyella sp. SG562]